MPRILFAALMVLLLPSALAEPTDEAVTHAAKACTFNGAFGRWFGEVQNGHIDTTAADDWAPFRKLTVSDNQIRAVADFRGTGETRADDFEHANQFLTAFDKAIKESGRFPHRQPYGGGVSFRAGEAGLMFDIRQAGDRVIADCVATGRPSPQDSAPE